MGSILLPHCKLVVADVQRGRAAKLVDNLLAEVVVVTIHADRHRR